MGQWIRGRLGISRTNTNGNVGTGGNTGTGGTVTPQLSGLEITPLILNFATANSNQKITATPKDQFGNPFVSTVTWQTSDASVATVDSTGNVTSVGNGSCSIIASVAGFSASAAVSVAIPNVYHISGVSSPLNTTDTNSGKFAPVLLNQDNVVVPNATYTYVSSAPNVITVDSAGNWAAQSAGTANITIASNGVNFIVAVTVTHLAHDFVITKNGVAVPNIINGTVGTTEQIIDRVEYTDAAGTNILANIDITSQNISIVTIDPPTITGSASPSSIPQGKTTTVTIPCTNPRTIQTLGGLASGVSSSGATIVDSSHVSFDVTTTNSAALGTMNIYLIDATHGVSSSTTLGVTPSVTSVTLTPSTFSIAAGQTRQLTAQDQSGNTLSSGITWTSNNTNVATVNSTGLVTGVSAGSATITAAYSGATSGTSAATITAVSFPTLVQTNSTDYTATPGTTIIGTLNSAPIVGNLMCAYILHTTSDVNLTPPSGWTRQIQENAGALVDVWYRIVQAGDGSSYTWTSPASDRYLISVNEYHSNSGFPSVPFAGIAAANVGGGTPTTSPPVTPTAPNTLPVAIIGNLATSGNYGYTSASLNWTVDTVISNVNTLLVAHKNTGTTDTTTAQSCVFNHNTSAVSEAGITLCIVGA